MPQPETSLHFNEYFRVIRNRLWVIFTIFALTLVSGIYVTEQVLPKTYTSSAQIKIQSAEKLSAPSLGQSDTYSPPLEGTEFQTEYERINSPAVLDPVVQTLGLDVQWAKRIYKNSLDKLPQQDARNYLKAQLGVSLHHGTSIVEISAHSDVPDEAAKIANAVAQSYKDLRDSEQATHNTNGAEALRGQMADQEKIVADRKAARETLRQKLADQGIIVPESAGEGSTIPTNTEEQLQKRQQDLLDAQQDADHRRVLYDSTKNLGDAEFVATMAGMGRLSSSLSSLQTDILNQESTVKNLLKQGFGDENNRVQAVNAQLAQEQDQYKTLIAGARNALKIDADMADAGVKDIQTKVNDLQTTYVGVQTKQILPFIDADREYQHQDGILQTMNIHLKEVLSRAPIAGERGSAYFQGGRS